MNIEHRLARKQHDIIKNMIGLRKPKLEDIFERRLYIVPSDITVDNFQRSPVVVFNPGALFIEDKILIFPRLIFDYYKYVSSIGVFEVGISEVLEKTLNKPVHTTIILWPQLLWEFLGCEDPRVYLFKNQILILYTGKGYCYRKEQLYRKDVLGFAELDESRRIIRKGFFKIVNGTEEFIPESNKDSTIVGIHGKKAILLTRPEIEKKRICWRGEADISELTIEESSLEPVFPVEEWEIKVGWSTNVVKLSTNEYLVGWHAVLKEDLSYKNGIALVDDQGELLAISDYLLAPQGLQEEYGDRPLVIFGDGLIKYKEVLFWIGGVSDYCIGIFTAQLDNILERLRWLRG